MVWSSTGAFYEICIYYCWPLDAQIGLWDDVATPWEQGQFWSWLGPKMACRLERFEDHGWDILHFVFYQCWFGLHQYIDVDMFVFSACDRLFPWIPFCSADPRGCILEYDGMMWDVTILISSAGFAHSLLNSRTRK